jgi:hypothetical protein
VEGFVGFLLVETESQLESALLGYCGLQTRNLPRKQSVAGKLGSQSNKQFECMNLVFVAHIGNRQ